MATQLLQFPSFKSDLVAGLACFDCRALFHLPGPEEIDYYWHTFHSFRSRSWLWRELQNVHTDDYVEIVDNVRHIYLDDPGTGPAIEDMISFLSSCLDLARREYNFHILSFCCLCLGHFVPSLPRVELGSGRNGTVNVDLSCVIEPLQGYLLSTDSERNLFKDSD